MGGVDSRGRGLGVGSGLQGDWPSVTYSPQRASAFGKVVYPLGGHTGQHDSWWICCCWEIQTGAVSGCPWRRLSFLGCLVSGWITSLYPKQAPLSPEEAVPLGLDILTCFVFSSLEGPSPWALTSARGAWMLPEASKCPPCCPLPQDTALPVSYQPCLVLSWGLVICMCLCAPHEN